jgi:hypothetical protein
MNKILVIAQFFLDDKGTWIFKLRLFTGDNEKDVLGNVDKYWRKHLPNYVYTTKTVPYFDELGSAPIAEIHK